MKNRLLMKCSDPNINFSTMQIRLPIGLDNLQIFVQLCKFFYEFSYIVIKN